MFFKFERCLVCCLLCIVLIAGFGCSSSGKDEASSASSEDTVLIPYDMVISGGRVIDPETGGDEIASLGIKNGVIARIESGNASLECPGPCMNINAAGMIVSPGFINTHTHEGNSIGNLSEEGGEPPKTMVFESSKAYAQDGITFWLGGNCGLSPTGVEMKFGEIIIDSKIGLTMAEFLETVLNGGLFSNYGTLTGNISLRGDAGLEHQQEENDAQISEMVKMLEDQMALGSFGISFGPFYDPGATKKAMTELASASRRLGGMSAIHMRMPTFNTWNVLNPWAPVEGSANGPNLILFASSVTEAIDICKDSLAPMIVSHVTDVSLNGSLAWVLDKIEKAYSEDGLPIAADIIGYDTFSNDLLALTQFGTIPPGVLMTFGGIKPEQLWAAEDVIRTSDGTVYVKAYERLKSISQAQELVDGFLDKTLKVSDDSGSMSLSVWCNIVMPDATMYALKKPYVFMGNDGGVSIDGSGRVSVQPRTYACFSRLLGHWSREEQSIGLKEALFKSTIAPAVWLGLKKKGRLQEGCDADIVIFDPDTVIDNAEPEEGMLDLKPSGFSKVIVNGEVVVDNGMLTGKTPGNLIRRDWEIHGNTKEVVSLYNKRFTQ